jgi:hypothetical protein
MICNKCGSPLDVIRIEEPPEHLSKVEKLVYERLCDTQCLNSDCKEVYYAQPYDFGKTLNVVRGNMKKVYSKEE